MLRLLSRGLSLAGLLSLTLTVTAVTPPVAAVSWTLPNSDVDGTALPVSQIAFSTVSWSRTPGGPPVGSLQVKAPGTTASVPLLCGTYQFSVTVTTTPTATYPNATSGPAGPVSTDTKVPCAPNPPGALAVH